MNKTENPSAFPWANDADKQYNWINNGHDIAGLLCGTGFARITNTGWVTCLPIQNVLPDAFQEAPDNYPAKRLAPFWAAMAYQLADEMMKAREA
jgi:hypothetical protein